MLAYLGASRWMLSALVAAYLMGDRPGVWGLCTGSLMVWHPTSGLKVTVRSSLEGTVELNDTRLGFPRMSAWPR